MRRAGLQVWIVLLMYDSDDATPFEKAPGNPCTSGAGNPSGPRRQTPQKSMTDATTVNFVSQTRYRGRGPHNWEQDMISPLPVEPLACDGDFTSILHRRNDRFHAEYEWQ